MLARLLAEKKSWEFTPPVKLPIMGDNSKENLAKLGSWIKEPQNEKAMVCMW